MRVTAFLIGLCALALLTGCATVSQPSAVPAPQETGGGFRPEQVVESYFEDLGAALQDPDLANPDRRSYWVERLAGYFAPNERNDQRAALRESLGGFTRDIAQLAEGETVTLELRGFDTVERLPDDGARATVRLPEAAIYMLITRTSPNGTVTLYEDTVGLDRLIGTPDKTVPLINIGGRWYLTEG